eukprot:1154370-Pelagomonas_calceolata.AAC.2
MARQKELEAKYPEGTPVPKPPHWGGFLVRPTAIEFWQVPKNCCIIHLIWVNCPTRRVVRLVSMIAFASSGQTRIARGQWSGNSLEAFTETAAPMLSARPLNCQADGR